METGEIITMITNLGFPICMTIYLLYYMNKLDEKHDKEVEKLREIVEKNTLALISLKEAISDAIEKGSH